jgi:tetratricopeptide (TPR) repeat protein
MSQGVAIFRRLTPAPPRTISSHAMRAVTRVALLTLCAVPAPAPLAGQGRWIPPQPPCDLPAGHFKVNGGMLYLKTAAEKPSQKDQQLGQARKVLTEAIVQDHQDKNPAAWYYLGRYYFETGDAAGADTALGRALALAPKCADDIEGYRRELWAKTVNAGLAAWQEGKEDSARVLFHLGARLEPANPKAFAALAGLYASKENDDSALAYYRRTAAVAGSDTAFARDKKDALANAWRLLVRRVQGHPAAQEVPVLAARLDSIARKLPGDSAVLAKLVAASQSRRARKTTLAPADQKLFARDSTVRAQAVERARAVRAATLQQLAADSTALATTFAPAIAALQEYLAAYPDAADAATWLATLYAQSSRPEAAAAVFDSLAAHARDLDPGELFTTGQRLVGQGFYRAGTRALAVGLERNPYRREALYLLGVGYYQLRDSAHLLPVAQRVLALDPLNRATLKLVAAGWDLRGRRDSTAAYLARADSTLAVEILVSVFVPDSSGASLSALATNRKSAPSKPFRLTFEFLDARGQVVTTVTQDLPALPPGENKEFDLKASGKGIAGWRYRAS